MSGWGNNGFGSSSWGSSGLGRSDSGEGNKDPEGQHNGSCIAGNSAFGNRGLFQEYYDEKCSGCRRDRAMTPWGSRNSAVGKAIKIGALYSAGKSIWK